MLHYFLEVVGISIFQVSHLGPTDHIEVGEERRGRVLDVGECVSLICTEKLDAIRLLDFISYFLSGP